MMRKVKKQKLDIQSGNDEIDASGHPLIYYLVKGSFCKKGLEILEAYVDEMPPLGLNKGYDRFALHKTPLMIAIECNNFDTFKYIFTHEHFDLFEENDTFFDHGGFLYVLFKELMGNYIDYRYIDFVLQDERLLESGNERTQFFLFQSLTMLNRGFYCNNVQAVQEGLMKCLNHPTFNINYQTDTLFEGKTTAMMFCEHHSSEFVTDDMLSFILNHQELDLTLYDNDGKTLIFFLISGGLLLHENTSVQVENIIVCSNLSHRDVSGRTVLHHLFTSAFKPRGFFYSLFTACLENNVDVVDNEGITPLMEYAKRKVYTNVCIESGIMVDNVISKSKNMNITCKRGYTALGYACKYKNYKFMECLVKKEEVDVNLGRGDYPSTPIDILQSNPRGLLILMKNQRISITSYIKKMRDKEIANSSNLKNLFERKWSPEMNFAADYKLKLLVKTLFLVRQRLGWSRLPKDVLFIILNFFPLNDRQRYRMYAIESNKGVNRL